MSTLPEQITKADSRIEQLKLQVQQQIAYIDCLQREHYDVKRMRLALDAMLAELSIMQRYRLSLYQEAAFVGERREKKAS
jgi:BMFP domain-containing protein YqiC